MDDIEFRQRALANPRDPSREFAAAAAQSPSRQRLAADLLRFEDCLDSVVAVAAPAQLRERLRDPASLAMGAGAAHGQVEQGQAEFALATRGGTTASPVRSRSRRLASWLMPAAACLLIAVGAAMDVWRPQTDPGFEQEIFTHIYRELGYLGVDNDVSLATVNLYMAAVGGKLREGDDIAALKIRVADDCWVKGNTVHLVIEGSQGPVTVLLVRNSPVGREYRISDERFAGLVTPTRGGNLVLVGEKQEQVSRYKGFFTNNLGWEY